MLNFWKSSLRLSSSVLLALLLCDAIAPTSGTAESGVVFLNPTQKSYQPATLEADKITAVGSDSMGALMSSWVDAYKKLQPKIEVHAELPASAAAPAALLDGTADIGPMARPMSPSERNDFRARFGFEPTQIKTAVSAIGVYVAATNPLKSISMQQLDSLYSSELRRGGEPTLTWGALGVKGDLADVPIRAARGVDQALKTTYFRQTVLKQGAYRPELAQVASAQALFDLIAKNPNLIGFANLETPPQGVKLLSISLEGSAPIAPTTDSVFKETYPLARYLSVYVVRHPYTSLEPAPKDFLTFLLSKEGQQLVLANELIPLSDSVIESELAKLQ